MSKTAGRLPELLLLCALALTFVAAGSAAAAADEAGGFIIVTNPPAADFFTSTRYGGAPFTVAFSDSSRGAGPLTYLWDFGDGAVSPQRNPSHTYRYEGEYEVRLTVTNRYGSDTKAVPAFIGVGQPPQSDFTASAVQGTAPFTVTFTDTSRNRPTAWEWHFGDGATSAEQNPVHTYREPGTYSPTLATRNNFGSDSPSWTGYLEVHSPATPPAVTVPAADEEKPQGIAGLIRAAKGPAHKDVPAGAFIPPQFMALAAMLTSLAVIVVQFLIVHAGVLWQFLVKFTRFFTDLLGGHAAEKISEKEIAARRIAARRQEPHFLGLSSTEILVIEAAVIIVALAFLLADRAELTLTTVLVYMAVGGISVVLHDLAHRIVVTRHGHDADTQFWGLGTGILFLTAWLFGSAFALSYRNLVSRGDSLEDPKETGAEMAAGPLVSLALMAVSLGMVALGGIWAVAGGIGFTVNLMTALYSLMPIDTMDGPAIWRWNRGAYLALFVPVLAFYLVTYIMV